MRKLLLLLVLSACAPPPRQPEPPPPFNPVLYVTDCCDPYHDHERPEDAILDNEWPPVVCIGGCR